MPLRARPQVEALEERCLLANNPFATTAFRKDLVALLQGYSEGNYFGGIPQASVALLRDGLVFAGGVTNKRFFRLNSDTAELRRLGDSQPVKADTLFRVASVGKTYVGAALLVLQQDLQQRLGPDYSLLDQSAFGLIGYSPGQVLLGSDPEHPHQPVTATVPEELFRITVADLLHMQSGLNGDEVFVRSLAFPNTIPRYGSLFDDSTASYAALLFGGLPPEGRGFRAPATVAQCIDYFVYLLSSGNGGASDAPVLFRPDDVGTGFNYQNVNFELGALVVDTLARQYGLAANYADFLHRRVLAPIGIELPPTRGRPDTASLLGPAHIRRGDSYPTEATYYVNPRCPNKVFSVLPDPDRGRPFHPARRVFPQYGQINMEPEVNYFLVATPTALAQFDNYLAEVLMAGTDGPPLGPLSYDSVNLLLSRPASNSDPSGLYFALGIGVIPSSSDPDDLLAADWFKDGGDPGTSAFVTRVGGNGVFALVFNYEIADAQQNPFFAAVMALMAEHAQPGSITAVGGSDQTAPVGGLFTTPLQVLVKSAAGLPLVGVPVFFEAPTESDQPSARFPNGTPKMGVLTNEQGLAVINAQAYGETGTYTVRAFHTSDESLEFELTNTEDDPFAGLPSVF